MDSFGREISDHPLLVIARMFDPISWPVVLIPIWLCSPIWASFAIWWLLRRKTRWSIALALWGTYFPGSVLAFALLSIGFDWMPLSSRLHFWTSATSRAFGLFKVFWLLTGLGLVIWAVSYLIAQKKGRDFPYRTTQTLFVLSALLFVMTLPTTYYLGNYKTLEDAVRNGDLALAEKRLQFNLMGLDANTGDVNYLSPLPLQKCSLLPVAIQNDDLSMVKLLLDHGARLRFSDVFYGPRSAISQAARSSRTEIVTLLLDRGADPNEGLHPAARGNQVESLRLLIERGGDVTTRDPHGRTLLDTAAISKAEDVVTFLSPYGLELTDLHGLMNTNQFERFTKVVESGYDVNGLYRDWHDRSIPLLHNAVDSKRAEFVEYLMAAGAEPIAVQMRPDEPAQTPLHLAARYGGVEEAKILLRYGVDPDVRNGAGVTPLYLAASNGNAEMIEILLDAGADVNYVREGAERDTRMTPLLLTVAKKDLLENERLLLTHGADPNLGGDTKPLMHAVRYLNFESVGLLLEHGAALDGDPKQRSLFGTLINQYPRYSHPERSERITRILETAKVLIDFGADPKSTFGLHGRTAIEAAEYSDCPELAEYLRFRVENSTSPNG